MENNNMLAKISLGINLILVIAVIIIFVKMPSGSTSSDETVDSLDVVNVKGDGSLSIAYYNSDTLSQRSDFVQNVQKEIEMSNKRGQDKMANKEREIQRWQKNWEEKIQTGLLPREQKQYQTEAQQKQMEIAQFEQSLQMEVAMEQENLMLTMLKRLQTYAKSFCQKHDIDMLVSFQLGQGIIYLNPEFEVTGQFLKHVNKEYNNTFEAEGEESDTESADGEEE